MSEAELDGLPEERRLAMAKFGEVFSTTFKVTISIILVLVAVWVISAVTFHWDAFTEGLTPSLEAIHRAYHPTETATAQNAASRWEYTSQTDEMSGTPVKTACLLSSNRLEFGFPYNGGSQALICLRSRKNGDAYVMIDKGQFQCGFDACNVKIKFDNEPTRNFTAVRAADGSPNILFIVGYGPFLSSIKQAKHVKLQALFYQAGEQVMEFDTSALQWDAKTKSLASRRTPSALQAQDTASPQRETMQRQQLIERCKALAPTWKAKYEEPADCLTVMHGTTSRQRRIVWIARDLGAHWPLSRASRASASCTR